MRTTLTLDDDLLRALKQRAVALGIPLKALVNQALRAGLASLGRPAPRKRFRTPVHHMGRVSGFDLDRALHVAADLETEEVVRKAALRK